MADSGQKVVDSDASTVKNGSEPLKVRSPFVANQKRIIAEPVNLKSDKENLSAATSKVSEPELSQNRKILRAARRFTNQNSAVDQKLDGKDNPDSKDNLDGDELPKPKFIFGSQLKTTTFGQDWKPAKFNFSFTASASQASEEEKKGPEPAKET